MYILLSIWIKKFTETESQNSPRWDIYCITPHLVNKKPTWAKIKQLLRATFPCFIPMHIGEQFGYRYAITVWSFWHKIDVIDSFFPLFPYLLIYRTGEVAGSNPARSTYKPPDMLA